MPLEITAYHDVVNGGAVIIPFLLKNPASRNPCLSMVQLMTPFHISRIRSRGGANEVGFPK